MNAQAVPPREVDAEEAPVRWQVPDNWEKVENPNRFRVATFHITGTQQGEQGPVEVAISSLPGEGGGVLANLNRWRGQVGLQPLQSLDNVESAVTFRSPRTRGVLFDLVGPASGSQTSGSQTSGSQASGSQARPRMLVAVVRTPERTWFVKVRGAQSRLTPHRDAVLRFARSFRYHGEGGPNDGSAPQQSADTGGTMSGRPNPHAAASRTEPQWQVPSSWHRAANTPNMLHALFHAPVDGDAKPARISVVPLPGRAGGALANVNRWRRQLGLPPVETLDAVSPRTIQLTGGEATLVDLGGSDQTDAGERTMAAWTQRDGTTWFFKLTGAAAAVDAHEQAFRSFVSSVNFGNAK